MVRTNRKRKRQIEPIGPSKKRDTTPSFVERDVANINNQPLSDEIEALPSGPTNYGGNYYEHLTATDDARVHNGAVIQINNIHGGVLFGFPPSMPSPFTSPNAREVVMATCAALVNMAESSSGAKDAIAYLMRLVSRLGKQLFVRVSVLEDSFGRPFKIDIDTIGDWREFESLMLLKFEGKRGHLRLQDGKYRLQSNGDTRLVNPLQRPNFAKLFAPGKYVKMTMHFGNGEVMLGRCPKCLTEQETSLEAETTCEICRFAYTTESEGVPEGRRSKPVTPAAPVQGPLDEISAVAGVKVDEDRPEHFKNVSIGQFDKDIRARIIRDYQRKKREDEQDAKAEERRIREKIEQEKINRKEKEKQEWDDFLRKQRDEAERKESEKRDYQMQLMLLEQQNKKRLYMARQENESVQWPHMAPNEPYAPGSPTPGTIDSNSTPPLKSGRSPSVAGSNGRASHSPPDQPWSPAGGMQQDTPAITSNFKEFLSLYGHFAGEELDDDDAHANPYQPQDSNLSEDLLPHHAEAPDVVVTDSVSHGEGHGQP